MIPKNIRIGRKINRLFICLIQYISVACTQIFEEAHFESYVLLSSNAFSRKTSSSLSLDGDSVHYLRSDLIIVYRSRWLRTKKFFLLVSVFACAWEWTYRNQFGVYCWISLTWCFTFRHQNNVLSYIIKL